MKNKKLIILIIIVVGVVAIIALVIYSGQKKDVTKTKLDISQVREVSPVANKDAVKKIVSDAGIADSGFAATKDALCFVDKNKNLSIFNFKTSKVEIIGKNKQDTVSSKILGTDQSCLFVEYGNKTTIRLWNNGELATPSVSEINWIDKNQNLFAISQTNGFDIFDSSWNKVSSFPQSPTSTFSLAPVDQKNAFAIADYDQEAAIGSLVYIANGQTKALAKVSVPYRLKSNASTVLMIYQKENSLFGDLISKNGQVIKTIEGVDSGSILETPDGYYFATKPAGADTKTNEVNSLIYISNGGKITSVLNSIDQSTEQFNINNLASSDDKLFYQDGQTIFELNKPADLAPKTN